MTQEDVTQSIQAGHEMFDKIVKAFQAGDKATCDQLSAGLGLLILDLASTHDYLDRHTRAPSYNEVLKTQSEQPPLILATRVREAFERGPK